jgi:hypothetical protein
MYVGFAALCGPDVLGRYQGGRALRSQGPRKEGRSEAGLGGTGSVKRSRRLCDKPMLERDGKSRRARRAPSTDAATNASYLKVTNNK